MKKKSIKLNDLRKLFQEMFDNSFDDAEITVEQETDKRINWLVATNSDGTCRKICLTTAPTQV